MACLLGIQNKVQAVCFLLKVTCVHKANIMKLGDGLFMRSCDEIAKMYPNIQYDNMIGLFHL